MSKLIKKTGREVDSAIGIGSNPVWKTVLWDCDEQDLSYEMRDIHSTWYAFGTGSNNCIGVVKDFHLMTDFAPDDYASLGGHLDLSYAPALITGETYGTYCSTANFNYCPSLEYLNLVSSEDLTYLSITGCTNLKYLEIQWCTQLADLDYSLIPNLEELRCNNADITSLDLRNNPSLITLDCDDNTGLVSLDFSNNLLLDYIDLGGCESLTSLDISASTGLTYINCYDTSLDFLDVNHLTNLDYLKIGGDNFTGFDVQLPSLTTFQIKSPLISEINLSSLSGLNVFACTYSSGITSIDLSACTGALRAVYITNCPYFNDTISGIDNLNVYSPYSKEVSVKTNNLSAANLNAIMTDLPATGGVGNVHYFWYGGNPGTATCDPTIATNKGWNALSF